jgi:prolyl oligopeptidase
LRKSSTRRTAPFLLFLVIATSTSPTIWPQSSDGVPSDKYAWLEDVNGEKQLAWVKAQNARTAAVLEKDPHFAPLQAEALKVLESPDRLASPDLRGGAIYNFWQDADHARGIVRRTTFKDYLASDPKWETVLDYDALSRQDKQSWVAKDLNCLDPDEELCMVELSAGGEDAVSEREMDLKAGRFVQGGFALPRGKQSEAWLDKDTLLIARDWGMGTMSESGYPITIRQWKRGEALESASEVFRGDTKDTRCWPLVTNDGHGRVAVVIERDTSFFESEWYLSSLDGMRKLVLPLKSSLEGFVDNQLIFSLHEDWLCEGLTTPLKQGSVVSFDLEAAKRNPAHLKPVVLFAPTAQEFEQQVSTTRNHVILTTLEHVQGRAYVYTRGKGGDWTRKRLAVPDNQTIFVQAASKLDDRFFLGETGFLNPNSIWLGDAGDGSLKLAKVEKPMFDASKDVVEQLEANSKDGTRIPYFLLHRKDMPYDGSNPTLLTAYGGFEVSSTPHYDRAMGKLWLERCGAFALANIRGGGEFGPAWHEAGLKTNRQRIYDDFYAVAQDMVTRKITSPRRFGIIGGSNGGLLMGVEFTQHPEMWDAVVIAAPLLDMLGYEHLSAGASWVGEYGSASIPAERAFLASISPYHQLKPDVHYPEPLIFTTTKDDRVGPVHARKFAARMEEYHLPFYYDEITEGGHSEGADNKQKARTDAEKYTYLIMKLMN